jgi:D-alanine-D-alanine ligase-like ATP-grasp enzyme
MAGKIAFIYNWVPTVERKGVYSECSTRRTVESVEEALYFGGYQVMSINLQSRRQLEQRFRAGKPDFALVIAEGFLDSPATLYDGTGAALVRQSLAELGIPSSHSPAASMELCRHKELTYGALSRAGVRVPWNQPLADPAAARAFAGANEKYPLFVKPAGGGNSVGIDEASVVRSPGELVRRMEELYDLLGPISLVVEEFLPGVEYTVGVIGNGNPVVLPPVAFPHCLVRSTAVKKAESMDKVALAIVSPQDGRYPPLRDISLKAYAALGCADVVRIDFKADGEGQLYVIDVNGTPSLGRASSLARMTAAVNVDYYGFINLVLYYGLKRSGLAAELSEPVAAAKEKLVSLSRGGQVA